MKYTNSKKKLLQKYRLYVIIDKKTSGKQSLVNIASQIKNNGRGLIVQLRDKISKRKVILEEALRIRAILADSQALFIINDYLDIAKITDSDGVHLGQGDTSIETARRILGKDKIIGISCHSLKQALQAEKKGADYIGIGPIFPTPTKPQYSSKGPGLIKKIKGKIGIPFFAIGGINENTLSKIRSCGAERIAVCSAICKSKNILSSINFFNKLYPETNYAGRNRINSEYYG